MSDAHGRGPGAARSGRAAGGTGGWLLDYAEHLQAERGLARRTVAAYVGDVRSFEEWAREARVVPMDAAPDDVREFLASLRAAGLSERSVSLKLSALDRGASNSRPR